MAHITRFKDLGIKPNCILGEKKPIDSLINCTFIIDKAKIDKSKFEGRNQSGMRMQMQIRLEEKGCPYSCFTGSDNLIRLIEEAREAKTDLFPLEVTLVKIGRMFSFN